MSEKKNKLVPPQRFTSPTESSKNKKMFFSCNVDSCDDNCLGIQRVLLYCVLPFFDELEEYAYTVLHSGVVVLAKLDMAEKS